MIPEFDQHGHLPPGIHPATMEEIADRFGRQSELRQVQMESLRWMVEAAGRASVVRIIVDGSFTTDRLEPNDVDCAVMTGPDVSPDQRTKVESLSELPFLHVLLLDAETFDLFVDDLFGTDRWKVPKGFIEISPWN